MKRLIDLLLGSLLLVLVLPIMLLIALLLLFTSRESVVLSQRRIGRHGSLFRCYKFRTMVPHADGMLARLLRQDESLRLQWEERHKLIQDPRMTRIGAWLRKFSLDELPQLWNVLKGDMSLVGPRPLQPEELYSLGRYRDKILSVAPGLTGLAQARGRSQLSFAQRLLHDAEYVRRRSLLFDLRLLVRTVPLVFGGRGAY